MTLRAACALLNPVSDNQIGSEEMRMSPKTKQQIEEMALVRIRRGLPNAGYFQRRGMNPEELPRWYISKYSGELKEVVTAMTRERREKCSPFRSKPAPAMSLDDVVKLHGALERHHKNIEKEMRRLHSELNRLFGLALPD